MLLLFLGALPAHAQDLFSYVPERRNSNPNYVPGPDVVQSKPIRYNTHALQEKTFHLDLFGKEYSALNQTKQPQIYLRSGAQRTQTFEAKVQKDGKTVGDFLLVTSSTKDNVSASGRIRVRDEEGNTTYYELTSDSIEEKDPLKLNTCSETETPEPTAQELARLKARRAAPSKRALDPEESVVVDVLVLYHPSVTSRLGSHEAVEAKILLAEEMMNQSLEDANVNATVNFVHYQEANIGGSSSFSSDLNSLRTSALANDLRDQYGADMVTLLRLSGQYCGIGYFMSSIPVLQTYGDRYMYSVTAESCIWYNTFTHELGHNSGLAHDRDNAPGSSGVIDGVAYGKRFYVGNSLHRSIMAYAPGYRVGYYSGPDVLYQGVPTGDANNNNASVLRQTMPIISEFRESLVDPGGPNYLAINVGGVPGVHVTLETGPADGNYTNSRVLVSGEDGKVRFDDMIKDEFVRVTAKKGGYTFSTYTAKHRFATTKSLSATPQTYSVVIKALDDLNNPVSLVYVYDEFGQYLCRTNNAGICSAGSYKYGEPYSVEVGFTENSEDLETKFFPQGNKLTGKIYGPVTRVVVVHDR